MGFPGKKKVRKMGRKKRKFERERGKVIKDRVERYEYDTTTPFFSL